ncbi:hypothetical protein DOTSEDRAFT_139785, partial [Dothistroma septosporum NZE10]
RYYNKKHKPKSYYIGEIVLLSTKNLKLAILKKKIGSKFIRPYYIIDAIRV